MIDENKFLSLFETATILLDQFSAWPNQNEISIPLKAINDLIKAIKDKNELMKNANQIKNAWNDMRLFCKRKDLEKTDLLQDIRWTFTKLDSSLYEIGLIP